MQPRGKNHFAASLPLLLPMLAGLATVLAAPLAPLSAAIRPGDPEPQRVTLKTDDKLTLVATYYASAETTARAPGVVLVHSAGGSRAELKTLALRLQKSGFAALTLDLRGHGESATEEFDWKKLDSEGQARAWALMSRDVKAGVDFLLDQKGLHSTSVSLVGHGTGCALVARQATRDERVRDLVLLSPQLEELGSSLTKDLVEVAGMPVYFGVGKSDSATAKRLGEIASRAAGASDSVETAVSKVEAAELLGDNKSMCDVARWMKSKALPGSAVKPTDFKRGR